MLKRFYELPNLIEYYEYEIAEHQAILDSGQAYNEVYTELWLSYYTNLLDEAVQELNTYLKEYLLA